MKAKLKHYRVSVEVTALDEKAQRELYLGVDVEADATDEREAYDVAVPGLVKKDLEQDGLKLLHASPFGSSDTEIEEIR